MTADLELPTDTTTAEEALQSCLAGLERIRGINILDARPGENFATIAQEGRRWRISAHRVDFREWSIDLHDLIGPLRDDCTIGTQEPGRIIYSTPQGFPRELRHHAGYLADFIRRDGPKARIGDRADRIASRLSYKEQPAILSGYSSPRLIRLIVHPSPDREWSLFCAPSEKRRALVFLSLTLDGYDPPDGLLLLEACDMTSLLSGEATSAPMVWSAWKRTGWSLREIWTARGSRMEATARGAKQ